MEAKLLVMLLTGLWVPPAYFQETYIVIEKLMNWTEALDYCETKHNNLAMVENAQKAEELLTLTQRYSSSSLWIGLRHEPIEWTWSLEMEGYYDDAGTEFRRWNPPEPTDITQALENCVSMGGDGLWYDTSCRYEKPFTCFTGSSPNSFSLEFVDKLMSWKEAQSYCRQKHTDLASVRNQQENDLILEKTSTRENWIGLYRDPWRWLDGTLTSFTLWNIAANEPNGGVLTPCVVSYENMWEDHPCSEKNWFICRTVPLMRRVVKFTVTTEDLLESLEDEAEAIMEQLNERVTEFGMIGNVTLTWSKQPDGNIFHKEKEVMPEEATNQLC